jgi:putative transposase
VAFNGRHAKLVGGFTFTIPDTQENQSEYPQAKTQRPGIGAMVSQGTDACYRFHHLRHSDFRRGKRLGKYDHLIVWQRPQKPTWMDAETYQKIPETIVLREHRFSITEPGFRTKSMVVITTLLDDQEFSKEDVAQLYGFRGNVELDIRSIKSNLNLDHVRCKSPEMV